MNEESAAASVPPPVPMAAAAATKDDAPADDSAASDVEMEGMDLDGDDEEEDDNNKEPASPVKKAAAAIPTSPGKAPKSPAQVAREHKLQEEEALELEAARNERMELLSAAAGGAEAVAKEGSAASKLEYLLGQSEVFAHFMAGSVAATTTTKRGKKKSATSSRSRMTEAEEDAQMLKTAASKRRGIVRLDHQPSLLASHCSMRAYQLEGLNWMIHLHDHGIHGILADEMGLGKTLQTISLLTYLREARGVEGPHLVVVPKSVVGNWIKEFNHWCPDISAIKMGGKREERDRFIKQDFPMVDGKYTWDVLVTSYEGLLKEKSKLGKVAWKYLIIDEAHRIKNENSSLSLAVRLMKTDHRLLITGTPLQNNLRELFALLNFIMPDVFGDSEQFDAFFSMADESGKENVIKKLHTVLRPFMLRRVKKDVATDLPPKKETKLYIGLTKMQQDWYIRCLSKDVHELNKLGGPERARLMNVLMQLRKVCNHPYLFDGAEPGPPFSDGPHLWENSGKMQLLNKLLPKLKSKGSRVLIFCQMTRMLDILEDYMRFLSYEYCRIDGNTEGELRDAQINDFNSDGSSKFCFLLSTRAGGLGINLATADIVILYDSDWNPQVDLQAMDRAHRIGAKKPVQVFRFITEGSVEEKIIERADRKLFLDAAVIQQGRLAEQNSSLEKDELMKMVRFGADEILNGKGGLYTDEDIDALIAKGEERTEAMQAKLQTDAQHSLANFSLLADDGTGRDTFSFDGKNYRDSEKAAGNFINLPQRQRKRTYDSSAIEQGASSIKAHAAETAAKKKRKGPALHDFQLFDLDRHNSLLEKERALVTEKEQQMRRIKDLQTRAMTAPTMGSGVATGHSREELQKLAADKMLALDSIKLSDEEEREKKKILAEGFVDWSRKDYRTFCMALERHGRYDFDAIFRDVESDTGKGRAEIQRYFVAFFTHYTRIQEWPRILERIERGEKKILRLRQIRDAIQEKVERHLQEVFGDFYSERGMEKPLPPVSELINHSWSRMKMNYGSAARRGYQEAEDAFLICMMYRHGYGAAERIRMEIRRAWQFRFNWYFKSRSSQDIQKRCDMLIRMIERENAETQEKENKTTVDSTDAPIPNQTEA